MTGRFLAVVVATLTLGVLLPGSASAAPDPIEPPAGRTIVSFTFDGTHKGQQDAARILANRGMAGTFYINSGYVDYPAYLSVDQVRFIARQRNEIGGASLFGNDLSRLTVEQARDQVCNDRATLSRLGFQVTSFSYPHGASTAKVKRVVQSCGYNNAREYAGLYGAVGDCDDCPAGEAMPPVDYYRIRTAQPDVTLEGLQRRVQQVQQSGGGWVPLVFTRVCDCPDRPDAISPDLLRDFVIWLKQQPSTTVRTVDQVMRGSLKPAVGTPLKRLVHDPTSQGTLPRSSVAAWNLFGFGIGQAQIVALGVTVSAIVIVTFRIASRRNRYVRG